MVDLKYTQLYIQFFIGQLYLNKAGKYKVKLTIVSVVIDMQLYPFIPCYSEINFYNIILIFSYRL